MQANKYTNNAKKWRHEALTKGTEDVMETTVYVLHGHWETMDERGVTVVCVSVKEEDTIKRLKEIADSKARDYCTLTGPILHENRSDSEYELSCNHGGFVGFYITEHRLEG